MNDHDKSKERLLDELAGMRERVAALEAAEKSLRETAAHYRIMVEKADVGIALMDLTHTVVMINSKQASFRRKTPAEMIGRKCFHGIEGRESVCPHCPGVKAMATGTPVETDTPVVREDGSTYVVRGKASPVFDPAGKLSGFVEVVEDITERKQAEESQRQSYEELRAIHDGVADGIIIVDAATRNPIRANITYCRMLGLSEDETRSLLPEHIHPPAVLPLVHEHLETASRNGVARLEALPFVRRDGTIFYADVVSSPIRYNQRPCWICLFHDVTDRKQAQEALKREFCTLKHLLQSSDRERQLIAYEIHDELAQQLAGAIMQFQTYAHLRDTKPKGATDAFDAGMTMLRQGHCEARRLIAGVRPPILDEEGVVAAVGHLVNEQRLRKGPTIEFHNAVEFDRLVPILENAIYRMVQEGLANACQHSKSQNVRVELFQHVNELRITIQDWGVGFDPGKVRDDRFGLEGIRECARLLGGNATVESVPGQGTCITVELPLLERE